MSELYDDTHVLVAASHVLFTFHYCTQGALDKAHYSCSMALRMLEQLMQVQPLTKASHSKYKALYLHVMSVWMDLDPQSFVFLFFSSVLLLRTFAYSTMMMMMMNGLYSETYFHRLRRCAQIADDYSLENGVGSMYREFIRLMEVCFPPFEHFPADKRY
jgi:hypothetical protein